MRQTFAILAICIASTSASSFLDFQFTEYHERSLDPKFKLDKHFGIGNDTFTKMTGRFRFGSQKSADQTFFATYWSPGQSQLIQPWMINALIFVAHGYAEYLSNDYDEIARHWSQQIGNGALVFGHDHAGHGRSTVGERALVEAIKDFTGPIIAHIREMKKLTEIGDKKLPVFIAAHSMGGLISLNAILEHPALFDGFIGIGPLVKIAPSHDTPEIRNVTKRYGESDPSLILMPDIDVKLITRDVEQLKSKKNDTLKYHGGIQAGMAWLMFQETDKLQNNLGQIELPMLVLQGQRDQIVDPKGARMLYQNANSADKEYKEYPGAYHQLLVELQDVRDDVIERTTNWLNERMP